MATAIRGMAAAIRGMAGMDMPGMKSPPPSPPMPAAGGGGRGMPHGHGMMGMHMTFFWGSHVQILFSGWPGDRGIGIYVLAVSAMLELLSFVSGRLSRHPKQPLSGFLLTALHAVRMLLAYLVMLAVMSFNVGVLIAAAAGHAIGYLICGSGVFKQSRPSPGNETEQPANHDCLHSAKY